ncbi:MAG TPA: hypothetical protein VHZ55_28650, partial [Bryobacteraceae bacterium]|nr:hypothetical protein [Bryobacteraceae bacterium]
MAGHSMGGNVILELAARFPEIPSSLVMIDSVMFPPQMMLDAVQSQATEGLQEPDYLAAYQQGLSTLCLPTDRRSAQLISSLRVLNTFWPQHFPITLRTTMPPRLQVPVVSR